MKRIRAFDHRVYRRVSRFVISRHALFLITDDQRLSRDAHQHFVLRQFEIVVRDGLLIHARCIQRCFIYQVREIGAGESGRTSRNHRNVDIFRQRNLSNVNGQNSFAAFHVRTCNHHAAIETSRPQQCRIENIRPVRCGNQDDAFVGFEAVHFDEQLIECLLALVVSAAKTGATMAPDGVDFIYKDDARRILFALFEKIADAAGADADKHFHEIGTGDGEEGHVGFAGDGAGEKSFAGSWRPDEEHALGNAAAEFLEFLRVFKELDDFLEFFLGFFDSGDIFKCDLLLMRGQQPGAALAKRQRFVASALHLAHEENPESY